VPDKCSILDSPRCMEYRSIRTGERIGDKRRPIALRPRVSLPNKNLKSKKFEVDVHTMMQIARDQGIPPKDWAEKVTGIPVYLLSDNVLANADAGGVVYVERALYTARGRLCASALGAKVADQNIDVRAYARDKTIKEYGETRHVECNENCPMWSDDPKKKTDCRWRIIVTMQLQNDPVFPSPTVYRTRSEQTIRSIVTSLSAISRATGGVLMGIPLLFRQVYVDGHDASGAPRRYPIMVFDFMGTIQELRKHAIGEGESRNILTQASRGHVFTTPKIIDVMFDDDGELEEPKAEVRLLNSGLKEADDRLNALYNELDFTPARKRGLEERHAGDIDSMIAELEQLTPNKTNFDPSAGEMSDHDVDEEDDGFDDDLEDIL